MFNRGIFREVRGHISELATRLKTHQVVWFLSMVVSFTSATSQLQGLLSKRAGKWRLQLTLVLGWKATGSPMSPLPRTLWFLKQNSL